MAATISSNASQQHQRLAFVADPDLDQHMTQRALDGGDAGHDQVEQGQDQAGDDVGCMLHRALPSGRRVQPVEAAERWEQPHP